MSLIYLNSMIRFPQKFILVLCLSFSLVVPTSAAVVLPDVLTTNSEYPAIDYVQSHHIMNGSEDGQFHPELSLTRCELAKVSFIAGAFTPATDNVTTQEFSDVPVNSWCHPYLHVLKQANVIHGYGDGTFHPNQKVSQIEALKILFNGMRLSLPPATRPLYHDVNANDWWAPYIQYAQGHEITHHRSGPNYGIQNEMTREETAHIIWRLLTTSPSSIPAITIISPSPTASSTTLTTDCQPENCTNLDWHIRARALTIPDYTHRVASDGKLILKSERFQVILPDNSPNAEEYGRIMLYQLRLAYQGVRRTLGHDPYVLPNTIIQERVLNHDNAGSCCGSEAEGYPTIWNAGTRDQYLEKISLVGPETGYLQNSAWDTVVGDHELTHRFNWTLNLSSFIDEGLANYVQDRGEAQPIICQRGGYEQSGQFIAYEYLFKADDIAGNRLYNSGDCFWQRIEQLYGLDMVHRIEARFQRKAERDALQNRIDENGSPWATWTSISGQVLIDLQQAFVPEIGDRFWTDFQDFCFSPMMAEGKTYESERSESTNNCSR